MGGASFGYFGVGMLSERCVIIGYVSFMVGLGWVEVDVDRLTPLSQGVWILFFFLWVYECEEVACRSGIHLNVKGY